SPDSSRTRARHSTEDGWVGVLSDNGDGTFQPSLSQAPLRPARCARRSDDTNGTSLGVNQYIALVYVKTRERDINVRTTVQGFIKPTNTLFHSQMQYFTYLNYHQNGGRWGS